MTVDRLVHTETDIAIAYTIHGTHHGEFAGIAPTGLPITARGMQIARFEDGKIVERWGSSDELGILLNAQPNQQGLATVNPIFTWVRLAQRIPVRIALNDVPDGVVLAAGMTATVQIDPSRRSGNLAAARSK